MASRNDIINYSEDYYIMFLATWLNGKVTAPTKDKKVSLGSLAHVMNSYGENQDLMTSHQDCRMTMDQIVANAISSPTAQTPPPTVSQATDADSLNKSAQSLKCSLLWEEESAAKYVCHVCKKTFYNMNALQNHKNMHHDVDNSSSDGELNHSSVKFEQNYNGLCGFKFIPLSNSDEAEPIEDGLTMRVFEEDTSYLIVKVEGEDADNLDPEKRLPSDGFIRRNKLKQGKQAVDLRGPFTCTFPSTLRPDLQCRQIFFNCCEYSLHYREEHTKRRKAALRCQVCEKRLDVDFLPSNTLTGLIRAAKPLTFFCRCGMRFSCSSEYDEHNRLVHAKLKPHQCSICSKRFTQQGGLQQHMRMHTGIRPFVCTFCPKAFTQKAGLDQHLRTHTKVKPFKCVVCSKCFSQSVHLRQHMRTHTNIQPFECAVCGKRFKQSSHLNFHMRSHLGEAGALAMERYAQLVQEQDHNEFFNLANLQPVQDGETMYYAAELAPGPATQSNPFNFEPQFNIP